MLDTFHTFAPFLRLHIFVVFALQRNPTDTLLTIERCLLWRRKPALSRACGFNCSARCFHQLAAIPGECGQYVEQRWATIGREPLGAHFPTSSLLNQPLLPQKPLWRQDSLFASLTPNQSFSVCSPLLFCLHFLTFPTLLHQLIFTWNSRKQVKFVKMSDSLNFNIGPVLNTSLTQNPPYHKVWVFEKKQGNKRSVGSSYPTPPCQMSPARSMLNRAD